jgi:GntR family transcriptional regulator
MTLTNYLRPEDRLESASGPRYVRLRQRIEQAIDTGILAPSSSLPPERELAGITDLSRVTVRRAIRELVVSGVLTHRQGSGSFVRDKVQKMEQSLSQLTSFTEGMALRGKQTTSVWLERGIVLPSPEERAPLGLAPDLSAARLCRQRHADGKPMAIERATLPLDILPNPLIVVTSLYEVLGAGNPRPVRAVQRISAINLDEREAGTPRRGVRDRRAQHPAHLPPRRRPRRRIRPIDLSRRCLRFRGRTPPLT